MNPKLLLIIAFSIIGIILISGCINKEKTKDLTKEDLTKEDLGNEILNIGESIPEGWNYKIITQNIEETERPHGLRKPVTIVNFTNINKEIEDVKTDKKYNPSLRLYFYNITEKQEIMKIIDQEKIYSWCIPIYFDETKKYIIVTSACYINSGIFTEEAKNYYSPLEKSLKDYFDKFKN